MYDDVVCAEGLSSLGIANQMSPYVTCRGVLWRAVGRSGGGGGSSCVCYQRAGLDAVWERDGKEEEDKTILYDAGAIAETKKRIVREKWEKILNRTSSRPRLPFSISTFHPKSLLGFYLGNPHFSINVFC